MTTKDKKELMKKLKGIMRWGNEPDSTFATALAYLINEWCPDDRTTKTVFKNSTLKSGDKG